jgi:hypothetical protein
MLPRSRYGIKQLEPVRPNGMVRAVGRAVGVAAAACFWTGVGAAESSGDAGGVVFDSKRLTLTAEAGKSEVFGTFTFTNRGTEPVEFIKSESACPCVESVFEKGRISPGATSELGVVIHLEALDDGAESKTILAQFLNDRGSVTRHALKVDVRFPELATIEPAELSWERFDEPATRQVVVSFGEAAGFKIRDWNSTIPGLVVAEEKASLEGSQRFKVSLPSERPGSGAQGHLIFNTTSRLPHYQQLRVPLRFR